MDERAIDYSAWNAHSNVTVRTPGGRPGVPVGPRGQRPRSCEVTMAVAAIDGDAGTRDHEVERRPGVARTGCSTTSRRCRTGSAAARSRVIGVGGGRDILTAIWAGNTRITGIEINKALVGALRGRYRDVCRDRQRIPA